MARLCRNIKAAPPDDEKKKWDPLEQTIAAIRHKWLNPPPDEEEMDDEDDPSRCDKCGSTVCSH